MTDDYTRPDGDLFDARERDSIVDEVDDILGEIIDGRYEVLSRLGSGGMGFVWEVRDLVADGRAVVLKTLRPELVNNEKTAERFSREAMASASIDHENVIRVLGHGVTQDFGAYYVMERLIGRDLAAAIAANGGPLSVPRTLEIASQVASALGAAHARAIVHRDLKPENIYLAERDGKEIVKVLDFGLARLLDAGNKLTETGAVIGTPRYMAPEQCQGEKVDPSADVYSLALVMHEMLTAQQPYRGYGTYEILGKKMFEDMPAPSQLDPPVTIDPRVEAFLMRCLARSPDARPRDGARMLEELAALREEVLSAPTRVASTPPPAIAPPASVPSLPAAAPPTLSTPAPSSVPALPAAAAPRRSALPVLLVAVITALLVVGLGVGAFVIFAPGATPPAPSPVADPPSAVIPVAVPAVAAPTVRVTTEPVGAEVRLGERVLGRTPLDVAIGPEVADGASVELALEGYAPRTIVLSRDVPTAHVMLHAGP